MPEPLSMSVATSDPDGLPDVRTVLLRDLDLRGPAFYTSTTSAKGEQLAANPGMAVALALSLGDPAAGPVTAVLGTDNRAGPRGALIVARPPR